MRQPTLGANPVRACWINDLVHRINVPCVPCRRMINANSMLLWDIVYTKYYRLLDSCVVKTNITVSKWDIRFFMVPDFFNACYRYMWIVMQDTTHSFLLPWQLLAYHLTVLRGYNVDQPRNLAKSVTTQWRWKGHQENSALKWEGSILQDLGSCLSFLMRLFWEKATQGLWASDGDIGYSSGFHDLFPDQKHVGCMWIWVVRTVWCGWWMLLFSIYLFFR